MSPKAKPTKVAPKSNDKSAKPAPAAPVKKVVLAKGAAKASKPTPAAKPAKGGKAAPAPAVMAAPAEGVDPDELEEAADEAAASSAGGGSAALAAAAAGGGTEMSASFKNFRHHPDMENFYRFIYENDLRHEALEIIDQIMIEKQQRKALKAAKAQAH